MLLPQLLLTFIESLSTLSLMEGVLKWLNERRTSRRNLGDSKRLAEAQH